MSLTILSASSMAVLLATTGLSSVGLSSVGLSSVGLSSVGFSSEQRMEAKPKDQSVYITDSLTVVTGDEPSSAVLIHSRHGPRHMSQQSHQQIQQQSGSRAARLNQPYTLAVETTGRALNADVKVDGQTIKTLVNQSEEVNLSPYLSAGQHTVEISGTYSPASATAQLLLTGPGTQISQQVSGRGILRQTLQISVQ